MAALAAAGSRPEASAGASNSAASGGSDCGRRGVGLSLVGFDAAEALAAPAARLARWRSLATAERRAWSWRFASLSFRSRRCISPESRRSCIHAASLTCRSFMASAFLMAAAERFLGRGAARASVGGGRCRPSVAFRFASVALRYAGSAQLARCTAERRLSGSLFRNGSSSYSSKSSTSNSRSLSCSSRRVRLVRITSGFSTKKPVRVRRLA
mmetsp:Transcript_22646/g.46139  ORF Transcript_22646/g.46139 Transcript_22646/m.46139 type:complete len:212 (+) Transcript_22646:152-787(+)